jgi:lipopolysaccharide export system permease protein
MRLLARYLVKETVLPMLFGVCAFTSLFVSGDLINLANLVMQKGAPVAAALKVFLLGLPQIVVWTFPMAVLLATLLSLSKMSANSEIVAMRAGGYSFNSLVAPIMSVALLISLLTFTIQELIVPAANAKAHRIMVQEIQGGQLPTVTNHVAIRHYEHGDMVWWLYARSYDGKTQTMQHATIVQMSDNKPSQTTYAERIVWENDAWYMENGTTYFLAGDNTYSMQFGTSRQPVNLGQRPDEIAAAQKDPEQMSLAELRDHIGIMRSQGAAVAELEVKMHLKYAIPFASLVFALIGVPLGIQPHRSASSIGFGLSIIIIFVYYVLMTLGTALGQGGYMPPWLGAWLQNIIISGVGLYLMRRTAK